MGSKERIDGLVREIRCRVIGLGVQDDGMSTAEYSESSDYSRETNDP